MSETTKWPEVQVCVILPCGTISLPVEDGGTVTCRAGVGFLGSPWEGHADAPETGLLAGMRRAQAGQGEPTPWWSAEIRETAMREIEGRPGLDEETRQALLTYVRRTPWYEF